MQDTLTKSAIDALTHVVQVMASRQALRISIEAHAACDPTTVARKAFVISENRAKHAASFLRNAVQLWAIMW